MIKKCSRFLSLFVLFVLCAAVFSFFCVLIVRPGKTDPAASQSAVQADFPPYTQPRSTSDARALARYFSHPLPVFTAQGFQGEIHSVPFEGENALTVTMTYPLFSLTCVQPALAAPLLINDRLTPASVRTENQSVFSILSMPAIYLTGGHAHAFYFSDDSAAYLLYTDQMELTDLAHIASLLSWVS